MSDSQNPKEIEKVPTIEHENEFPELVFANQERPAANSEADDDLEGLLLQLMVRLDTLESRIQQKEAATEAHAEAIRHISEAYQVIVSDLTEIEKTLHNIERTVGLALQGRDITGHIRAIRDRLGKLQIFQPNKAAG